MSLMSFEQLNVLISEDGIAKLTDFGNTVLKNYTLQFTGVISESNYTLRWAVSPSTLLW